MPLAANNSVGPALLLSVWAVLGFATYFLPAMIAVFRGHHNTLAILVLNLLAGWTFIGYVVALVWACTSTRRSQRYAQYRAPAVHNVYVSMPTSEPEPEVFPVIPQAQPIPPPVAPQPPPPPRFRPNR